MCGVCVELFGVPYICTCAVDSDVRIVANVHRHDIESVAHVRRSRDVRTVVGLVHHALYTTKGGWGVPYRTFAVLRTTVWSVEATCPGLMPGLYLTVEREHPI